MKSAHIIATMTLDTTNIFAIPFVLCVINAHGSSESWLSKKQPADVTINAVA
jgi:hypothetical protein